MPADPTNDRPERTTGPSLERTIERLALERKVGQLFLVGFPGTGVGEGVRELVAEYGVGGVVYFDRNVEDPVQVAELSRDLGRMALESTGIPPLIATDQEGDGVARIPFGTRPPAAMAVGATRDEALARELGRAVARQLRSVGVGLNFAPVLDVNVNPDNPVIGVRSFGSDPDLVGELGVAVLEGLQSGGVAACGKHFPGHGDTAVDSHHAMPLVEGDRDRLDRVELAPFRAAVGAGVEAVMTAHVGFPAVEPDRDLPATLSENAIGGVLREELGYDGVVVTDCMEMDAVAGGVGTVEGAVRAIAAGADLVLVSHSHSLQTEAIEAVLEAVRTGEVPESRIDGALERVLRLKDRRLDWTAPRPRDGDAWHETPGDPSTIVDVTTRVARRSVTLVRDGSDVLPVGNRRVTVAKVGTGDTTPVEGGGVDGDPAALLVGRLSEHGIDARRSDPGPAADGRPGEDAAWLEDGELGVAILAGLEGGETGARDVARTRAALETGRPVVLVAVGSPYDLRSFPAAPTALATYDRHPFSVRAAADVLAGVRAARGRLPVALESGGDRESDDSADGDG